MDAAAAPASQGYSADKVEADALRLHDKENAAKGMLVDAGAKKSPSGRGGAGEVKGIAKLLGMSASKSKDEKPGGQGDAEGGGGSPTPKGMASAQKPWGSESAKRKHREGGEDEGKKKLKMVPGSGERKAKAGQPSLANGDVPKKKEAGSEKRNPGGGAKKDVQKQRKDAEGAAAKKGDKAGEKKASTGDEPSKKLKGEHAAAGGAIQRKLNFKPLNLSSGVNGKGDPAASAAKGPKEGSTSGGAGTPTPKGGAPSEAGKGSAALQRPKGTPLSKCTGCRKVVPRISAPSIARCMDCPRVYHRKCLPPGHAPPPTPRSTPTKDKERGLGTPGQANPGGIAPPKGELGRAAAPSDTTGQATPSRLSTPAKAQWRCPSCALKHNNKVQREHEREKRRQEKEKEKEEKKKKRQEEKEKERENKEKEKAKRDGPTGTEDLLLLLHGPTKAPELASSSPQSPAEAANLSLSTPTVRKHMLASGAPPGPTPAPVLSVLWADVSQGQHGRDASAEASRPLAPVEELASLPFGDVFEVYLFCQDFHHITKAPQVQLKRLLKALGQLDAGNWQYLMDLQVALFRALVDLGGGEVPYGCEGIGVEEDTLSRWRRLVDTSTVQEVMRRYLLRAVRLPPVLKAVVQVLESCPSLGLPPSLTLFLLKCLVHDIMEADEVRETVEENLMAAAELARQKQQDEAEERRREWEEKRKEWEERRKEAEEKKKKAEEAVAARADVPDAGAAGVGLKASEGKDAKKEAAKGKKDEDEEPVFEVAEEFKVYRGDPNDRKAVLAFKERQRKEEERVSKLYMDYLKKKEAEKRAVMRAQQEEERKKLEKEQAKTKAAKKREEAYERELAKLIQRTLPLGSDRFFNRYWWAPAEGKLLFVEHLQLDLPAIMEALQKPRAPGLETPPSTQGSAAEEKVAGAFVAGAQRTASVATADAAATHSQVTDAAVAESSWNAVENGQGSPGPEVLGVVQCVEPWKDGVAPVWSCYSTVAELDALIASLDERGRREGPLKAALQGMYERVVQMMKRADASEKGGKASKEPKAEGVEGDAAQGVGQDAAGEAGAAADKAGRAESRAEPGVREGGADGGAGEGPALQPGAAQETGKGGDPLWRSTWDIVVSSSGLVLGTEEEQQALGKAQKEAPVMVAMLEQKLVQLKAGMETAGIDLAESAWEGWQPITGEAAMQGGSKSKSFARVLDGIPVLEVAAEDLKAIRKLLLDGEGLLWEASLKLREKARGARKAAAAAKAEAGEGEEGTAEEDDDDMEDTEEMEELEGAVKRGRGIEEDNATASEVEEDEIDLKGLSPAVSLWRSSAVRAKWREEVAQSLTLSALAYATASLKDRVEDHLEARAEQERKAFKAATKGIKDEAERASRRTRRTAKKSEELQETCGDCRKPGGPMLHCAGKTCDVVRHPECVGLRRTYKATWFCTDCRTSAAWKRTGGEEGGRKRKTRDTDDEEDDDEVLEAEADGEEDEEEEGAEEEKAPQSKKRRGSKKTAGAAGKGRAGRTSRRVAEADDDESEEQEAGPRRGHRKFSRDADDDSSEEEEEEGEEEAEEGAARRRGGKGAVAQGKRKVRPVNGLISENSADSDSEDSEPPTPTGVKGEGKGKKAQAGSAGRPSRQSKEVAKERLRSPPPEMERPSSRGADSKKKAGAGRRGLAGSTDRYIGEREMYEELMKFADDSRPSRRSKDMARARMKAADEKSKELSRRGL